MSDPHPFDYIDDPDAPGWMLWRLKDASRYNSFLGPISVRVEDGIARVRMVPGRQHSNLADHVHGGALLGFMDVALFAAARGLGVLGAGRASTVDLSAQFIAGAELTGPIEARVELLRETGRLLFLRALVVQGETVVASFSGTVRKSGTPA